MDEARGGKGHDVYDYTYRASDEEYPADNDVRVLIEDREGNNQLNLNQVELKDIKSKWKNAKDICLIISKDTEPEKQDRIIIKEVNQSIKKVLVDGHNMNMTQLIQSSSGFLECRGPDCRSKIYARI